MTLLDALRETVAAIGMGLLVLLAVVYPASRWRHR